jgi:hypothetical protein
LGPLKDGAVSEAEAKLEEIVDIGDYYNIAAFDGTKIGVILQEMTNLELTVRYLDEEALRDNDDDIIPTELESWTSSHTQAQLKFYVSIDLSTLRFKETELLTRDIIVY